VPGRALASAISSGMVFTSSELLATSASVLKNRLTIGAKSFSGS
jgi:hypothetical protein